MTAPAAEAPPGLRPDRVLVAAPEHAPEPLPALLARARRRASEPGPTLLGRPLAEWRRRTRAELGLPDDGRPVLATGHQAVLWHPGILAKYVAADRLAARPVDDGGWTLAHLVVDQHEGDFGRFDVPVRDADGELAAHALEFLRPRPDVPMVLHPAGPVRTRVPANVAAPFVARGIESILERIAAHADASDAAAQVTGALLELIAPWTRARFASFGSARLMRTGLARALLEAMVEDPWRCAEAYRRAVRATPEAGIPPLHVREDFVELPVWRTDAHGRRRRADDVDVAAWLEAGPDGGDPARPLLPRALLMTALLRLGACDIFVHGTGGAAYDRAMERWIADWLDVEPAPVVVATADLRLPLAPDESVPTEAEVADAVARAHRRWHDPEPAPERDGPGPGPGKRALLEAIASAPRGSAARRRAFKAMHARLPDLRSAHVGRVEAAQRAARAARRRRREARLLARRDWAFPLHPAASLEALVADVAAAVDAAWDAPSAS